MTEKQNLSIDDVQDVAGGVIEVTESREILRKITIDLKHEGKAIDVALQYCKTDEEREFVHRVWDGLE